MATINMSAKNENSSFVFIKWGIVLRSLKGAFVKVSIFVWSLYLNSPPRLGIAIGTQHRHQSLYCFNILLISWRHNQHLCFFQFPLLITNVSLFAGNVTPVGALLRGDHASSIGLNTDLPAGYVKQRNLVKWESHHNLPRWFKSGILKDLYQVRCTRELSQKICQFWTQH